MVQGATKFQCHMQAITFAACMKYGKLDNVDGIDFRLPITPDNFTPCGATTALQIRMGGTMWNIPEWVGKVYPAGTKQKDFLHHYSRQFSTIELNATHYKIPTVATVQKWCEQTPTSFRFCPKFPQSISHYRRFTNVDGITEDFLNALVAFGERLGPSFIQLPPHFAPDKAEVLMNYVNALPTDLTWAIEFRHPDWFAGSTAAEEVWQWMRERKIIAVISDTAGRRDAVHMRITGAGTIVRFGGNNLHASDELRWKEWIDRLYQWQQQGLEWCELWMHQTDSIVTPESCIRFAELWKERTGAQVATPQIWSQTTLF